MTVTLEQIEQQQHKLNGMIASFKLIHGTFPATIQAPALAEGEKWIGTIISASGNKKEHIILLPQKPEGKISWQDANSYAESIGGKLPDRVESALLFQEIKDEFEEQAYWTRETHSDDSSSAWYQTFGYGTQYDDPKSTELRARAVRSELVI